MCHIFVISRGLRGHSLLIRHSDVFLRRNHVIREEIRVIARHMPNQKNYNFDFRQLGIFSAANTFIVFAFKNPLNFDHI